MATIYFITEVDIKELTGVSANVDPQDFIPFSQPASDIYMREVLCSEFYDYLLAKYNAQTLNAAEILLVRHIKLAVAWRTSELALAFAWGQWKNKGPQVQSGDYSQSIDQTSALKLEQRYSEFANYYENRVKEFLKVNKDDYPEYTAETNCKCTDCGGGNGYNHLDGYGRNGGHGDTLDGDAWEFGVIIV